MIGRETEEEKSTITIDRDRYEKILIELGELRKLSEFLDEYRAALEAKERELKEKNRELEEVKEILLETEWKDYELEQTQKRLRELEAEVEIMKESRPWWKKLFSLLSIS
jgi:hypothetical protein